jgi:hypothetical protein
MTAFPSPDFICLQPLEMDGACFGIASMKFDTMCNLLLPLICKC